MSRSLNLIGKLLGLGFFAWFFPEAVGFWRTILPSDGIVVRGFAVAAFAVG